MAPAARASDMGTLALRGARCLPEELLQLVARDLESREGRAELRGRVANDVVHAIVAERDVEHGAAALDREAACPQTRRVFGDIVVEPDAEALHALGERRYRPRVLQPAGVDRDERFADAVDLGQTGRPAEQGRAQ